MAPYKRVFTLRIGGEAFDKVNALARKAHRSMTNFSEHILLSHLEAYERDNGAFAPKAYRPCYKCSAPTSSFVLSR